MGTEDRWRAGSEEHSYAVVKFDGFTNPPIVAAFRTSFSVFSVHTSLLAVQFKIGGKCAYVAFDGSFEVRSQVKD